MPHNQSNPAFEFGFIFGISRLGAPAFTADLLAARYRSSAGLNHLPVVVKSMDQCLDRKRKKVGLLLSDDSLLWFDSVANNGTE